MRTRRNGVLVADRRGATTGHALLDLERARRAVRRSRHRGLRRHDRRRERALRRDGREPDQGEEAHEHARLGLDDTERITPPTVFSLEQALEFIADDESVEVTPKSVRLRKVSSTSRPRAPLPQEESRASGSARSSPEG